MSARTLTTVRRAATQRARAATNYRNAILNAHAEGHTINEIAAAAGIRRQNVYRLLQRNETPKEGRAQ